MKDKLTLTVIAAIMTGVFFSGTCFVIGLVFPLFAFFAPKLFVLGALVGAYHGYTSK